METITKEYVKTLTDIEEEDLFQYLLEQGVDRVYLEWLIFDRDYHDVIKKEDRTKNAT